MNTRSVSMVLLAVMGGGAFAQENPNNFHARHNGESVYNVDRPQQTPSRQPTGYWEKTWGSIATSDTGGALGTAIGQSSREQAEQIAMKDCKTKGGGGCKIGLSYQNQCAVMVVGDGVALTRAASIEEAKTDALQACESKGDNCRVYYSACTEPIFHRY